MSFFGLTVNIDQFVATINKKHLLSPEKIQEKYYQKNVKNKIESS